MSNPLTLYRQMDLNFKWNYFLLRYFSKMAIIWYEFWAILNLFGFLPSSSSLKESINSLSFFQASKLTRPLSTAINIISAVAFIISSIFSSLIFVDFALFKANIIPLRSQNLLFLPLGSLCKPPARLHFSPYERFSYALFGLPDPPSSP